MPTPPETCPNCGADLPRQARACPECGADERTGWSDEAVADRLGLPRDPEQFDHAAWEKAEFGASADRSSPRSSLWKELPLRRRIWVGTALVVLVAWFVAWVRG